MLYAYSCPGCGPIESGFSGDTVQCRCGEMAKRRFHVAINRTSLRQSGRWDPVVGEYVANDREFRNKLREGQAAQEEKLQMEVKLETVDARDNDALSDLHGWKDRASDLEPTR